MEGEVCPRLTTADYFGEIALITDKVPRPRALCLSHDGVCGVHHPAWFTLSRAVWPVVCAVCACFSPVGPL